MLAISASSSSSVRGRGRGLPQQVGEEVLGQLDGDRDVVEAGEGGDADERPLELADVRRHLRGDELECLRRHLDLVALGLVAQDRQARLEVGRLDVGDEAPLEAAAQALLERRDGVGHAVARDDDLLVRPVQRVERVEELLLQALAVLEELDVVDEQDVDLAVAALEGVAGVGPDGVDELVEERLGGDVAHLVVLVVVVHVVADGVQQVGLAEPGRAVDEQRVVRAGGRLGDAQRGGEGELVRGALDERLERVARVQPGLVERRAAVGVAEPTAAVEGPAVGDLVGGLQDAARRVGAVGSGDVASPGTARRR